MTLFVPGTFTGHSGDELHWKIECSALTGDDWACLALMAVSILPPFASVEGVPRGGIPFARALAGHTSPGGCHLIADDVWTTGRSMRAARRVAVGDHRLLVAGVVAFSRSSEPLPSWCRAVVSVNPEVRP